jgi:hypothetical protein
MGRLFAMALLLAAPAAMGQIRPEERREPPPQRMPDGTLQSEAILKVEHERTLKELTELKTIIGEVYDEIEKNNRHVLSVGALKKLDDAEKRIKRIRSRLAKN